MTDYKDPFDSLNSKPKVNQPVHTINITMSKREYFTLMILQALVPAHGTNSLYIDLAIKIADETLSKLSEKP